ncbi:hypothetical protein [Microcystis phage MaeS]|nr:hypothetical protein [Microcystis phage MaeS]
MAKLSKFSDKVKKINRKEAVPFATDGGEVIEFVVESRSDAEITALANRYEEMKPPVPSQKVPAGKSYKVIENPNDPEYKRAVAAINKKHFNHMALMFLAADEKPEGTEEEQLKAIEEVELAGFTSKIVNKGLELSGLIEPEEVDEVIEAERKN